MPEQNERVSMERIAQRLGISAMTVSRALKAKNPPLRQDARELFCKIRAVAAELGYRKSSAPRSMLTGRYDNICVLGSDIWRRNHMPQKRLFAMQEAAAEHGVALLFNTMTDARLQDDSFIPDMLLNWRSDGLLINYSSGYPERLEELLSQYHAPAIWMNSKHEFDCIYPDDFNGAKKAAEHLIHLGHERIASWVEAKGSTTPAWTPHYSKGDRADGYRAAILAAGLEPLDMLNSEPMSYGDYADFLQSWLERPDRPAAIIAYGPPQATAIVQAAARLGLRIPEELSIVNFHDSPDIFQFTTMLLPEEELGKRAVSLISSKIAHPEKRMEPLLLPIELYNPGLSCAPPQKKVLNVNRRGR